MLILDIPQGSDEWLKARAGLISASNFGKILTPTGKKTDGKTRKDYLYQVAAERISGEPEGDGFRSVWMERGNELEADARLWFEEKFSVLVEQVGLVYMDDRKVISCSPDGLLGGEGLEIKCPKASTHMAYLDAGKVPTIYIPQIQGSMMVTGFDSWNFMSYHPAIKPLTQGVYRDEKYIALLREAVEEANAEVEAIVERVRG